MYISFEMDLEIYRSIMRNLKAEVSINLLLGKVRPVWP